ncbi:MAG: hypothetical protein SWH61_03220 [Thermodesulfobacteriota bacterium]|nr:hypothetical protein [Thermodesulfobacteriota bacterium]
MRESALPLNYNLSTLGADFDTIQDWNANRVEGVDLVGNMAGEVLYIPPGTYSDLTPVSLEDTNKPQTSDDDYFPLIIGEPDNKPHLQFKDLEAQIGIGTSLNHAARLCDLMVSVESEFSVAIMAGIYSNVSHTLVQGCVVKDMISPGAFYAACAFLSWNPVHFVNCATDASGTVDVGSDQIAAFLAFTNSLLYNFTTSNSGYDIGMAITSGTLNAYNCVVQNADSPTSGTVNQTTCAINQGLLFDTDGYTLLTDDRGNGTDLSSDPTCPFSDDIFGSARSPGQWERGASIYTTLSESEDPDAGSRHYVGLPSRIARPSLSQIVNTNLSTRLTRRS